MPKKRQYRPYFAYKHSGAEWIGEMPEHWEVRRLKYISYLRVSRFDAKPSDQTYIGLENMESWTGRLLLQAQPEQVEGFVNRFEAGDVLFGKLRPYLAKVARPAFKGVCTGEAVVLQPRGYSQSYLFYLLLNDSYIRWIDAVTYGTKMPRVSPDQIANGSAPFPPVEEQQAIASFLDRETTKIDALVAKKEQLMELLQEKRTALITRAVTKGLDPDVQVKDSGVEWLGKIPATWKVAPVYARYKVTLGKMLDAKRISGNYLGQYVRNIDVQWDSVNTDDLPQMDFSLEERDRYKLEAGDLLVCEGGDVGRTAIWEGSVGDCFYQKALHRVRPLSNEDIPRFFYYVMYALAKGGVFVAGGNPNTIDHLTAIQLSHYRFPFPPSEEQTTIAIFLDRQTTRIDTLIAKARTAIDRLKELRTALISAAVTGKIDVRDEADPTLETVP